MPKSSIADHIDDWQRLLATAKASAADVPGLNVQIAALEETLAQVQAISAIQDTRNGLRQQGTQERKVAVKKGKDLASQVRAILKGNLGIRNARLPEFGMSAVGTRKRTKANQKKKPPQAGPASNNEPEPAKQPAPASQSTPEE